MITKYSSNCKVCNACIRNSMQIKLVNILTYVQILSYKSGVTIP